MLSKIAQVYGFRILIGRFRRDIINADGPDQIADLLDTFAAFDHNIRRLLNGQDTIPEESDILMYEIDNVGTFEHKLKLLFRIRRKFL